ncbi:protein of unknown function (plasmid) [Cardinium endosymbiont cEper1 of Encarsia pergandiella]|uniref:hypothetical protein n=1 Tax=Cardinium endosymbiont of Encarsia pergandiella TaxID=249402 RepID=UPI00027E9E26|nr:hypothetical protein [Cardinium endosymbiont of Encarsia pergandiella]CCM10658.1 protein of unknown function [Cardinium endosymbiont cEper1 of Encarsia pergandiella]
MKDIKKKIGIRFFTEYESNPFIDDPSIKIIDIDFISGISKRSLNLIKYLIYKNAYTSEKFVFDFKEFNKITGYKGGKPNTSKSFIELIDKGLLARTDIPYVFWVNGNMLKSLALENEKKS